MTLMPQYSIRWCKHCGKSFGTSYTLAMDCPYCVKPLADVSHNWPHVCSQGHSAQQSGDCKECRK